MPIYTRTGDKGKTSLFDGSRVLKSHPRVETYGTIDELNSIIGVILARLSVRHRLVKKELEKIQHELFDVGSSLAVPEPMPVTGLADRPKEFEKLIDDMTTQMPELKAFILPGGSNSGSLIHVARTVARRTERQLVELQQTEEVDKTVVVYLNRLSDLLFTMARYVNHIEKKKEIKWIKK